MARERFRLKVPLRALLILLTLVLGAENTLHAGALEDRRAAIEHALSFLHATAVDDANATKYGSDLLWCFYTISHTSRDRGLRESAAGMGRELAVRWHKSHQHVPANATAQDIYLLVSGAYSADRLGVSDRRLKAELRKAALKFSAKDYLGFDATREPPSPDDPGRYDTWSGALITTYFGDAYGVRLGASYRDVVQWLPRFRPFDGHDGDVAFDAFYAATHVIYTLNRYHEHRIASSLLPQEIRFIRQKLDTAIADDDPEMVGEALDCLKAAGFENDPQVSKGMEYLISNQLTDGSWVDYEDDVYSAYHSAWTGIDGLRDYRFHGTVKKLPGSREPVRPAQ
jgi:hypothetical protein